MVLMVGGRKGCLALLVLARACAPQCFAVGFNLDGFIGRRETEAAGHAISKHTDMLIFKFDDFRAVYAYEVIVVRTVNKVGIVRGDPLAEVDFMQ